MLPLSKMRKPPPPTSAKCAACGSPPGDVTQKKKLFAKIKTAPGA